MTAPKKLSVYKRAEAEFDFVIAYSPDDAVELMKAEIEIDTKPGEWLLFTKPTITIRFDDGTGRQTKTPEEWVAFNGRGHLACSYA